MRCGRCNRLYVASYRGQDFCYRTGCGRTRVNKRNKVAVADEAVIRRRRAAGEKLAAIAADYDISPAYVCIICGPRTEQSSRSHSGCRIRTAAEIRAEAVRDRRKQLAAAVRQARAAEPPKPKRGRGRPPGQSVAAAQRDNLIRNLVKEGTPQAKVAGMFHLSQGRVSQIIARGKVAA